MKIIQGIVIPLLFSLLYSTAVSATHRNSSPAERLPVTQLSSGSDAIFFDQVNFELEIGPITDSDWGGQFRVKSALLKDRRGKRLGPGYINVFTYPQNRGGEAAWVVSNLLVSTSSASDNNDSDKKPIRTKHADNRQYVQSGREPSPPFHSRSVQYFGCKSRYSNLL